MDLISVSALVSLLSKIFSGTAGKAGEQLWDSLGSVVRRLFGRQSTSVEAVKRLDERPGDADAIRALAKALVDDSGRDPQAAAQLRRWLADARRTIAMDDHAPISGNVVRSRDVHDNVTF